MRYKLVEFLDKGRPGMASAILTRMRVGDKIVEPKGVSRLYQSRISTAWMVLLVVAAAVTIVAALVVLPIHPTIFRFVGLQLSAFWHWLTGLFQLIDFRYHLVSIVAVFLALAIGLVVGATALQANVVSRAEQGVRGRGACNRSLYAQNSQLKAADRRRRGIRAGRSSAASLHGLLDGEQVGAGAGTGRRRPDRGRGDARAAARPARP